MKKIIIVVITATCSIFLSSCLSLIASNTGLKEASPKLQKILVPSKEVYFLGMAHLQKNEFYENTKKIIADYQKRGFIFYVESTSGVGKVIIDTINLKKFRKLTSLDLTNKYSKLSNPILQKLIKKYELVDQPSYKNLGVTNAVWVDYSLIDLVNIYEKKYSIIELERCDSETNLNEEYKCTIDISKRNIFTNEIVLNERNKLIAKTLINSNDKKIIIIYGKKHFEGIQRELKQLITNNKP